MAGDCLYLEEWRELQNQLEIAGSPNLFERHYVFSRSPRTEKKISVQDLNRERPVLYCLKSRGTSQGGCMGSGERALLSLDHC